MIDPKKFIRISLIAVLFLGIFAYAYYRSKDAIFGITITSSVADGATLENKLLTITGNAIHASKFTINDRELLLDKNGNYTDTLLLQDGYTILELEASDRFGRTKTKTLHLYTRPNSTVVTPSPEVL